MILLTLSTLSIFAPFCNKSLMASTWPFHDASWSGIPPSRKKMYFINSCKWSAWYRMYTRSPRAARPKGWGWTYQADHGWLCYNYYITLSLCICWFWLWVLDMMLALWFYLESISLIKYRNILPETHNHFKLIKPCLCLAMDFNCEL